MNADSAFAIGKRHEVCQDYARSRMDGKWACAWISDGCSSSRDSDIGARLMVLSARQAFRAMLETGWGLGGESHEDFGLMTVTQAMISIGMLDLPTETLDATLLSLMCDGERVCLYAFGDGVLFLRWRSGETRCLDIELTNGYPDYLSYRLEKSRRDKYDSTWKATGGRKTVCGHWGHMKLDPHKGYAETHHLVQGESRLELVAVMSDGVRSFCRRTGSGASEPVPLGDVLEGLLDFRLHSGRFVQRRLNRFLKDAAAKGWEHRDDISVAAIHFGELA
jgi:hypothetical protein